MMRSFRHFGGNFKDFNPFCLPLATGILVGRNPYFLSRTKAFGCTFVALVYRNVFAKEDFCVTHFHAAQHVVPALDENPAGRNWRICRRINHFADESSIRRKDRWNRKQHRKRQTQHPAFHIYFDAKPQLDVGLLVVILKPQMSNERLTFQMAQRIFELHRLDK
jgi:hypothetical protein